MLNGYTNLTNFEKLPLFRVEFTYRASPLEGDWQADTDGEQVFEFLTDTEATNHVAARKAELRKHSPEALKSVQFRVKKDQWGLLPVITTHPKCYDYGQTMEIRSWFGEINGKVARLVGIHVQRRVLYEAQIERYLSDMTCVALSVPDFCQWLRDGLCGTKLVEGPTDNPEINEAWKAEATAAQPNDLLPSCDCGDMLLGEHGDGSADGADFRCGACTEEREIDNNPTMTWQEEAAHERRQRGII